MSAIYCTQPEEDRIGDRLRAVRETFGFSQRELARRSGVANATISLVEQNRVSPSLSSLKKILDGVPMTLADFFTLSTAPVESAFFLRDQQPTICTNTDVTMRILRPGKGLSAIQIMFESYAPGAHTGEIPLRHEGEEGGFVVRGEIHLTVGNRTKVLRSGDGYYFASGQPHRFANLSDEECEIVSANSPGSF